MEMCGHVSCKAVMVNGEFQEKEFFELIKKLGNNTVAAVRQDFFESIEYSPSASRIGFNGGGGCATDACFSYGFVPARERKQ